MRRVWRVVMFVAIGAVVNVLVAMACARWGSEVAGDQLNAMRGWPVESVPDGAAEFVNDAAFLGGLPNADSMRIRKTVMPSPCVTRTAYTRMFPEEWFASAHGVMCTYRAHEMHAFGLPMRSMRYETRAANDGDLTTELQSWRMLGWRGGWPIMSEMPVFDNFVTSRRVVPSDVDQMSYPPGIVYPLTPVALGFAVNTALYGLIAGGLMAGLGSTRQWRRARRGLCLGCGYEVMGLAVCPECGLARNGSEGRTG